MKNVILLSLFLISCGDRNIRNEKELKFCKADVMNNGDVVSYIMLLNYFDNDKNYFEILPYALKMIEVQKTGYSDYFVTYMKIKFNNKYDFYDILKLEREEREYLISILIKGAQEDDTICKETLIEYYKNGIVLEKNIEKADSIEKTFYDSTPR